MTAEVMVLVPAGLVLGIFAYRYLKSGKAHPALEHTKNVAHVIPHALGMLIVTAHASELVRVVEHASLVHLVIATLLFAAWFITKSGPEEI